MDKTLILCLMLSLPAWGQGILRPILSAPPANVVHTFSFAHASQNTACPAGTSCTVTVTSTTAGSLLVIWITGTSTGVSEQITGATCSPNACSAGAAAFTHCSNCFFSNTANGITDAGYVLSVPAGVTSVAITVQNSFAASDWVAEVDEVTYTGGGQALFDNSGGSTLAACTTCALTGITLSGTKDYVSRDVNCQQVCTAPGGVWINPANIGTTGVIGALNQTAAATFNVSQSPSGVMSQAVMAFK